MVETILSGDPGFPNSKTCEVNDLGAYAQHLKQTQRDKAIWKIPVKDWKHLKQAIFDILHGCRDELDNNKFQ